MPHGTPPCRAGPTSSRSSSAGWPWAACTRCPGWAWWCCTGPPAWCTWRLARSARWARSSPGRWPAPGLPGWLGWLACVAFGGLVTLGYGLLFGPALAGAGPTGQGGGHAGPRRWSCSARWTCSGRPAVASPGPSRCPPTTAASWPARSRWDLDAGDLARPPACFCITVGTGVFLRYTRLGTAIGRWPTTGRSPPRLAGQGPPGGSGGLAGLRAARRPGRAAAGRPGRAGRHHAHLPGGTSSLAAALIARLRSDRRHLPGRARRRPGP